MEIVDAIVAGDNEALAVSVAMAAAGLIPGVKGARAAKKAADVADGVHDAAKAADAVGDAAKKSVGKQPSVGAGATLEKLTTGEAKRIQNAANRSGKDISVVGSRVNPSKPLHAGSDYDFVIDANSKTRNNLSRSLPGAKDVRTGTPSNQDIFKGQVDASLPHVTFHPQ